MKSKIILIILFAILTSNIFSQEVSKCLSGDCKDGFGVFVWGSDSESSGDSYTGYWQNGLFHGQGTYVWSSGNKYIGEFANGNINGQRTTYFSNGTVQAGMYKEGVYLGVSKSGCVSGDCQDGYGKYIWTVGDEYIGYWTDGKQTGSGTYKFATGNKYVGEFVNGLREGTGTFTWADGEKYAGQWKNDLQHGEGTYHYTSGEVKNGIWKDGVYQGSKTEVKGCISGNCSTGYGTYVWDNGEKFVGYWANNMRNGQGINYFATGEKYDGEWKDDYRNGYGTNIYVDGTSKEGMWEMGRYIGTGSNNYGCISGNCSTGYGIYTWQEGERYEGEWINKMRNGTGKNKYISGAYYEGEWKDDLRHGYGYYEYLPGSEYKSYKGDYFEDKMTGFGTFVYANGDKYIGGFLENKFHGEGTYYSSNGTTQSGRWENDIYKGTTVASSGCVSGDCKDGFGTHIHENGDKYTGWFSGGFRNGEGTYIFAAGDTYVGEFKQDTYSGQGTYTFESGNKYVGEFAAGTYNGIGTMYYNDGTNKSGTWKDGVFVETKVSKNPPVITWLTPEFSNTKSIENTVKIKLCVKSDTELENVKVLVNGEIKINALERGYSVVNSTCDYTIEKEVAISSGTNNIIVEIKNNAGTTVSEIRTVTKDAVEAASNQKRIALVIGNGAYTSSPLRNPPNDAKAISAELRALGFEVMEYTDLSQADMVKYIRAFGTKLATDKGVGLFFFAGHGLQVNGENYIVPVNANIEKEQDVELEAVNLKRVLGEMDYAQNDLNIVILDACRNNPFARSFRSGGNNGLATTMAPKGTFIAYATAPGSVASDGTGNNGLYTQELMKAISTPGAKIEDVFKQVRVNVYNQSGKQQVPWENSSIFGDFYFKN